jgi:hypothetical protein
MFLKYLAVLATSLFLAAKHFFPPQVSAFIGYDTIGFLSTKTTSGAWGGVLVKAIRY